MILRRLVENLKQQHWTAVAIELVIVVLGVFIGLQAQEWATAHAEQQRADVLLQQLRGDLDSERSNMNAYMDYPASHRRYARTAIRGLRVTRVRRSPGTWVASIYQASQIYSTSSNRATFDEMKSTGAIDLIRNARLRALLISYYSFDWSQSSIDESRRRRIANWCAVSCRTRSRKPPRRLVATVMKRSVMHSSPVCRKPAMSTFRPRTSRAPLQPCAPRPDCCPP